MSETQVLKLFVHMPKCGGTSVRTAIEALGSPSMIRDYDSYFKIPIEDRRKIMAADLSAQWHAPSDSVIFGHFFPVKYKSQMTDGRFKLVTILRDPVQRLISHYRFWSSGDFSGHYLWEKMKSEEWSFYDFAFSSEMRNIYSQYFEGVDIKSFTYIGIYEHLALSAQRCLSALDFKSDGLALNHINVTDSSIGINLECGMIEKLKRFHDEDYKIYEYACGMNF